MGFRIRTAAEGDPSARPVLSSRFDVHHIVKAGLDFLRHPAELGPALAEFGRVVRRLQLLAVGPLDVVDDVAVVGAAVQADRYETWLKPP
jgi:hypothetical protein